MTRLAHAFRAFFSLLFQGSLAGDIAAAYGYSPKTAVAAPPKAAAPAPAQAPAVRTSDGALQMLGILQRDSRLVDFLMEDISSYSDDQVGAAVRSLHQSCRDSLQRYVTFGPVIDGVEGAFTQITGALAKDPNALKLIGNVPPDGKAPGGALRHRGWRAQKIELPSLSAKQDPAIVAPAEIEIE
ncbi:MAG TPA: DUF2760 domain-containing protein [Solibacterales bacterium]|nr:DUF2760 domain-containing protein [Bryobacterales bacterium]